MKETLKKTFNVSVLLIVGVVLGIILTFEFIVFPGLTAADTIQNILALLVGGFTILFAFNFIQWKKLLEFLSDQHETIPPGETEYDYIPKEEVIKKKRNSKQFSEIKSEEPFVKTKKKPQNKNPNTPVTPKVMGEYQVNNKQKVRTWINQTKK